MITLNSWNNPEEIAEKEISAEETLWRYDGDWKSDKKSGHGTLTMGKMSYEGNWAEDMREGHGTLIDEMGTYIGEWKQDQRHGVGVFIAQNKATFQGKFDHDRSGQEGEITWINKMGKTSRDTLAQGKLTNDPTQFNVAPHVVPNIKHIF